MKTLFENWRKYASGEVTLYHYSRAEDDSLLLDPQHFLTHRSAYSRNDYKTSGRPRIFFYTDLNNVEEQISSGSNLFSTSVPAEKIYDILEDPKDLKSMSQGPYGLTLNYDELFQNIVAHGYTGAYYTIGGGRIGIVVWFEPIKVTKMELQ